MRRAFSAGAAAAVLALALTACFPPESFSPQAGLPRRQVLTVAFVDSVPPSSEMAAAMNWWNGLAGRTLFEWQPASATSTTPDVRVYHRDVNACSADGVAWACSWPVDEAGAYYDFTASYIRCDIVVQTGVGDNWPTLAHELGHCLGFVHTDWRVSIMNSFPPDPTNPTGDRAMLLAAGYGETP